MQKELNYNMNKEENLSQHYFMVMHDMNDAEYFCNETT